MSEAMQRVVRARSQLVMFQPFFGTLALYLILVEDATKCEAMATDGKHLFFNPQWVMERSDPELIGVIAHEVEHNARRHHTRRGFRNFEKWNIATDYCINGDLLKAGFVLPEGVLVD